MSDSAVTLSGVGKSFAGHTAVADLSLHIPRGSIFGLLGPNGAGKTTTLRMVLDILAPDTGTIEILGRPSDQAARDRIGYMPEERGVSNLSGSSAPFDADSPYWIVPNAFALARRIGVDDADVLAVVAV